MSILEVTELVYSHGLEIVCKSPIGHLPMTEKVHIVPTILMQLIESILNDMHKYICKFKKT